MQWDNSQNLGFSTAEADKLYLPVDPNPDNTTVAAQEADPNSMLNHIRAVLALRKAQPDLGNYTSFEVVHAVEGDRLFAYKRGELLLCVNPAADAGTLTLDSKYEVIHSFGSAEVEGQTLRIAPQTLTVLKPVI